MNNEKPLSREVLEDFTNRCARLYLYNEGSDEYNTSVYADVEPFVDFHNIRDVMVITSFDGQGGINPSKEGK